MRSQTLQKPVHHAVEAQAIRLEIQRFIEGQNHLNACFARNGGFVSDAVRNVTILVMAVAVVIKDTKALAALRPIG